MLSASGGTSLTYIIPQPALVPRLRAEASLRYAEMTTKVQRRNWDKNIYFEINMWCADVLLVADRSSYLSHKMDFSGRPHIWWLMGGESSHLLFVLVNPDNSDNAGDTPANKHDENSDHPDHSLAEE